MRRLQRGRQDRDVGNRRRAAAGVERERALRRQPAGGVIGRLRRQRRLVRHRRDERQGLQPGVGIGARPRRGDQAAAQSVCGDVRVGHGIEHREPVALAVQPYRVGPARLPSHPGLERQRVQVTVDEAHRERVAARFQDAVDEAGANLGAALREPVGQPGRRGDHQIGRETAGLPAGTVARMIAEDRQAIL